jgi:hypothetical protein
MTSLQPREGPPVAPDIADQMATYGITRVPVDYFHVGKYRYSNLDDAIAEAKRREPAAKGQGKAR